MGEAAGALTEWRVPNLSAPNHGGSRRRREMPYESHGSFRLLSSVANAGRKNQVKLKFLGNLADQFDAGD